VRRNAAIAALAGAQQRSCRRITPILARHGCATRVATPGAGTARFTWLSERGTRIATGVAQAAIARRLTVSVRLTKAGSRLLRRTRRRVRIRIDASFTDAAGLVYRRTTQITLAR
jgi:hypothetical protein